VSAATDDRIYDANEVNGKFKITNEHWSEDLNDPESEHYQHMAETISRGIYELLEEGDLTNHADFNVTILGFRCRLFWFDQF